MHTPITVNYVPDGEDWKVTVIDEDQTQSATASGLIAARDQADQIVEKMVPNQTGRTVVHLLEGDALAFTNNYLQVRLGLSTPAEAPVEPPTEPPTPEAPAAETPAEALPAEAPAAGPPTPTPPPTIPAPAAAPTADATPTPAAEVSPTAPETLTPPTPNTTTPSPDKSPELADVPAQGANQAS